MCEGASGEGAAPRKDTVVAHSVGSKVFVEDTASDDAWVEGEVLSVDDGAAAVVVKLHGGKEVRATCEGPSRRGGVQPPANHPPTTGRVVGPLVHSWRPKAALRRAPGAARGAARGGAQPAAVFKSAQVASQRAARACCCTPPRHRARARALAIAPVCSPLRCHAVP